VGGKDSSTSDEAKLAHAARVLDQQNALLGELHSAYNKQAKLAAALCQAVKLAEDGVIDVVDVRSTARQLVADGSVKMSAVESMFMESPGQVVSSDAPARSQLDPLTAYLRSVSSAH
jgi:hypothetical protein